MRNLQMINWVQNLSSEFCEGNQKGILMAFNQQRRALYSLEMFRFQTAQRMGAWNKVTVIWGLPVGHLDAERSEEMLFIFVNQI